MYDPREEYAPLATMSDAHREWHLNSGVPMGQPGCPQDACHPVDEYDEPPTVKCGNKSAHGGEPGYHYSAAEVRECYAGSGRFNAQAPKKETWEQHAEAVASGVWHSTGPRTDMGHWEPECPGEKFCAVAALRSGAPVLSTEDAVAAMRRKMEQEQQAQAEAKRARYAAWGTIPVGNGDYAHYALKRGGHVALYRVERPAKGKWAGKTFIKRESGDNLVRPDWSEVCEALNAIAADPLAAAVLYGKSSQQCAICHRQLTDDVTKGPDGLTSVERGIGPKCARKVGRA